MFSRPLIIDNALPKQIANRMEDYVFSPIFPWRYLDDITKSNEEYNKTMAFGHVFIDSMRNSSESHSTLFLFLLISALDKAGIQDEAKVYLGRLFLQLPLLNRKLHNSAHIDLDFEHYVGLYYVNDSDGDTFFFTGPDATTITRRISPKKNRMVFFNGNEYHSSSNPTTTKRCVINFDFTLI